ncbi:MAG: hypothetical protein CMG55_08440 [Candidatus Marinimicrobia bacterium]|nr:hypothetical protein [Candidatus Neomarinimicrobiota bacterium]
MCRYLFLIIIIGFVFWRCDNKNPSILIESPNRKINVYIDQNNNDIYYKVFLNNQEVIAQSKLGLIFKNGEKFPKKHKIKQIKTRFHNNIWQLPWGETKKVKNMFNETIISFKNLENIETGNLIFRAYNDGIAFRYHLNNEEVHGDSVILIDELTQFNLIEDANLWWTPAYTKNRYEHLYNNSKASQMDTSHTPLTIKYKNGIHMSIHEASLVNYSSMQIFSDGNILNCDLAPWKNGDKVRTELPFKSPWRTLILVEEAKDLIGSNLILNCNEPCKVDDYSWIKPSKYIGIWWGMIIGKWTWKEGFNHGATIDRSKKYIDFASKHGFDEVLIEGWASGWESLFPKDSVTISFTQSTSDFDIKKIQKYANSKNISIQAYHETMANTKNYLSQIDSAFSLLNELGIKNVKIGHVGSKLDKTEFHYSQYGVNYYRKVLQKALEYKIGVNFHEPIKDTGERRTFPNMLTREGARGMEYNAWLNGNPPNHTLILPFTRLLNSPMDFTPGIFDLMYEDIDNQNFKEYPIIITVIDSGNGYENFRFKSSESIWLEKNMTLKESLNKGKKINTWIIKQNFQIGEWEWGIIADLPAIEKYNIWIPEALKNKNNRKIWVDENGKVNGQDTIKIPFQNLDLNLIKGYPDTDIQRVKTTLAKQLALYVVIYSPLQMAADFIDNYEKHPAFQFIKDVPVNWDTTIVLNGKIQEYVTIARKDRDTPDWYIGGITNENKRSFELNLSFLDEGFYEATIYSDGKYSNWKLNPTDFNISKKIVSRNDIFKMNLAEGGGQAIRFKYIQ